MRETIAAPLSGCGLEIGPYDSPFPVPVDCDVLYVDVDSREELLSKANLAQSDPQGFVIPVLKARFEDLGLVLPRSLDFFIASHVIEHTRDPLGCILSALSKLRSGGSLVLVVPDKTRTFDAPRPLTGLDHLIEDHRDPSRDRDKVHYTEYFGLAFRMTGPALEEAANSSWLRQDNIHYHTWTYETFGECVRWIADNTDIANVVSYPTRAHPGFEFYYKLTVP